MPHPLSDWIPQDEGYRLNVERPMDPVEDSTCQGLMNICKPRTGTSYWNFFNRLDDIDCMKPQCGKIPVLNPAVDNPYRIHLVPVSHTSDSFI